MSGSDNNKHKKKQNEEGNIFAGAVLVAVIMTQRASTGQTITKGGADGGKTVVNL